MASFDVVIIGAGPAGVAAGRRLAAAGKRIIIIEARGRIGGRAVTANFGGHAVDLGAHWLHAGPVNPVVTAARQAGLPLMRAPQGRHLVVNRKAQPPRAYEAAFARADRALCAAARLDDDAPASARMPWLGPWRRPVAAITALVAGRPLEAISARDFASAEYADNLFARGGFGALIATLARGLPLRLGAPATGLAFTDDGVSVDGQGWRFEARAAIVTIPPTVLQRGGVTLPDSIPARWRTALQGFNPAVYEHALIRWPGLPLAGGAGARDQIATLSHARLAGLGMLTRIDGSALHYVELDERLARRFCADRDRMARWLRVALAAALPPKREPPALLHLTDWLNDPWSRGSWSSVPPGFAWIRDALAEPVADRLIYAGEAADHEQWGTVGGAWASGERAAEWALSRL
jgi:monoamine oxidase